MVLDPRKRQKKLERRKAKERTKKRPCWNEIPTIPWPGFNAPRPRRSCTAACSKGLGTGDRHAARQPRIKQRHRGLCLVSGGRVLPRREGCLVRHHAARRIPRAGYGGLFREHKGRTITPEHARKLVEEAVAYARGFGLPPHPDYEKAKAIFGDIDAGRCQETFVFGREGKPFFVSGPNDSPARCRRIVAALTEHRGLDNFDYLVHVSPRGLVSGALDVLPEDDRPDAG
jgi:hypothetical protein